MTAKKKKEELKALAMKRETAWETLSKKDRDAMERFCADYIEFVSDAKTERECYDVAVKLLKKDGFSKFKEEQELKPGSCVIRGNRGKTLMAARIGKRPVKEGIRVVGGHTDAPRLDNKPVPLYEDSGMVLMDTHYYGGIRKYQWVAMPLAMHGVIIKENGDQVEINIGEDPADPVFVITDLLPHLAQDQNKKTLGEAITGEGLNALLGSEPVPAKEADKDRVKANLLKLLNKKYGVKEEDFCSAELELVPAGRAREVGFDRSMILAYGHDDRVCSYGGLRALLDMEKIPEYTSVVLLCDKEEIGSYGATGMDSLFFENSVAELIACQEKNYNDMFLRRCLEKSQMISADVDALHDPNYPEVSSPNNQAAINAGVVLSKYTGARGKSGCSEASAEFVAELRNIFNNNKVAWQACELGKVDVGGAGTIAVLLAKYCMDVIDCGVGLLSMHAPWEVAGKLDIFMAYKAYKAFMENSGIRNK